MTAGKKVAFACLVAATLLTGCGKEEPKRTHCFEMTLVSGTSTEACYDLTDQQVLNMSVRTSGGSYWLQTSQEWAPTGGTRTILKYAVIDFREAHR